MRTAKQTIAIASMWAAIAFISAQGEGGIAGAIVLGLLGLFPTCLVIDS